MSRASLRWPAAVVLALGATVAAGCGDDPEPACSLPSGVRCDGDTVVTCANGDVTRRDCGDEGLQCAYVDSAAGTTCVASACGVVGPLGRCTGATLSTCADGAVTEVECGADQVCGFVDATTGYACIAAAGPMSVAGEIRYEDKPLNGTAGFEAITPRAARGITVTVIDDGTMQPLATVAAADNGSYVAHFTAAAGTMVHVTAVARSTFTGRPISVTTGSSTVHGFGSASFPAAADATQDLIITDATGESEAFNVFDQAVTSMDAITSQLGVPAPVPLRLQWSRGSTDGTYFDGSAVHLLGAASSLVCRLSCCEASLMRPTTAPASASSMRMASSIWPNSSRRPQYRVWLSGLSPICRARAARRCKGASCQLSSRLPRPPPSTAASSPAAGGKPRLTLARPRAASQTRFRPSNSFAVRFRRGGHRH